LRICFIGKFPPIQGGVSRTSFWDSYALSAAGHEVHVVTNAAEVEPAFRIREEFYAGQPGRDPSPGSSTALYMSPAGPARHIPYANPFASRLAGTATQVATDVGADLIYAFYLEPYGVAARLASAWTGVPYGLRHAGSDVSQLARDEALLSTFDHLARDAAFWLDTSTSFRRGWQARGVSPDSFYAIGRFSLPTDYFHPDAEPMRLGELGTFDPAAPTIGTYGKLDDVKGSFDLVRAFAQARFRAGRGNLVMATGGPEAELDRLRQLAAGLGVEVLTIPFMPHWRIPSFIAACDAVAFLERGFPVDIHRPAVPREVLACGGCLILSAEVAAYQDYADKLRDSENCLIVDPRDHANLVKAVQLVLESPGAARAIGRNGYRQISQGTEDWPGYVSALSETFERIRRGVQERKTAMSVAEMQAALARLCVDEPLRRWFDLAPDAALAKYELDEAERASLRSINRKMLELFAESLRDRRRADVLKFYPLCLAVHEEPVRRYFDRFYDLHAVRPDVSTIDLALAFGRYLADCLAAEYAVGAADGGYAADLCRYEMILAEIGHRPLPSEDPLAPPAPPPAPDNPTISPDVRCARFAYDIPELVRQIEQEHIPRAAAAEETYLVLRPVRRRGTPEAFKVSQATAALLSLCTGLSPMEEVERRMAGFLGGDGTAAAALADAVDELCSAGLICRRPDRCRS
jgi:glycosyltransferase involved in cell wall biosynthesis